MWVRTRFPIVLMKIFSPTGLVCLTGFSVILSVPFSTKFNSSIVSTSFLVNRLGNLSTQVAMSAKNLTFNGQIRARDLWVQRPRLSPSYGDSEFSPSGKLSRNISAGNLSGGLSRRQRSVGRGGESLTRPSAEARSSRGRRSTDSDAARDRSLMCLIDVRRLTLFFFTDVS